MKDNNHGSFSSSCSSTNVKGSNKSRGCYPIGKIIKNVSVDHGVG
jgi:hypothetical protein